MSESPSTGIRDHAGLVAGLLVAAFVATRVMAVSGFDATSATAVLATQGTSNVVVGVLIGVWPVIGIGLVCVALIHRFSGPRRTDRWPYVVGIGLVLLFLVPWLLILIGLAALLLLGPPVALVATILKRPQRIVAPLGLLIAVAVILASAVFTRPWLPSEKFSLKTTGGATFVGYALGVEHGDLVVLLQENSTVARFPLGDLRRCLCTTDPAVLTWAPPAWRNGAPPARLLAMLFGHGSSAPSYPPCD